MIEFKVPDKHLPQLKEAYKKIYGDFKVRWTAILEEWRELEPVLLQLGIIEPKIQGQEKATQANKSEAIHPSTNGYNPNWTWMQKSVYILKKAGRPLTSKEIIDYLINNCEPGIPPAKLINSIPATLSVASKEGKLLRIKKDNGEYVYDIIKGSMI
jgi:hypothetical protein